MDNTWGNPIPTYEEAMALPYAYDAGRFDVMWSARDMRGVKPHSRQPGWDVKPCCSG